MLKDEATAELLDVVMLLATELVTNAVLHARSPIDLEIHCSPRAIRIEVADRSRLAPQARSYGPEAATGRGLALIEAMATDWGMEPRDDGKVVWFEVTS